MTAKRFTYDFKTVSILKDGEFWLDGQVATACNHSEICDELNALNDENEQLKEYISSINKFLVDEHNIDEKLLDDLYFNQVGSI